MATKLAPKCDYTHDSDTDASDYGFDLTAEEEDLLETLVASASSEVPLANPSGRSSGGRVFAGASSLRSDIAAAFATHASIKSLHDSEINLNFREALNNPASTHHDGPLVLSDLAASGAKPPLHMDVDDDDEISAVAAEAESRIPQPVQVGDVRYPDLSRALSSTFDKPDIQPPESDASAEQGRGTKLSPLVRFRSSPKKPFSVSDLVAGAWCELQYYYTLTKLPGGKRTRTAAMKGGSELHQKLEDEIYTTIAIEITKGEDAFGLKLWNVIQGLRTLRETGMTRELEVWGVVDGHVVNGVIDNLSYENPDPQFEDEVRSSRGSRGPSDADPKEQKITTFFHSESKPRNRRVFITDIKTRASRHIPSGAALRPTKIQLFLYHRFLSDMAAGRLDFLRVLARYGLEPDEPFSDTFVAQIGSLHDEIFEDAVDEAGTLAQDVRSGKSSTPSPTPDLIRYRTLRSLTSLLETELRLTFPDGADSLGSLVNVEYRRRRARRSAEGVEEDPDDDDDEAGALLGANVLFVDPQALDLYLQRDLQWWQGERSPDGVSIEEAYKCRSCEFANDCEWRLRQDAEILAAARRRAAGRKKAGT